MRRIAREDVFKLIFEYTFYEARNDGTLELLLLDDGLDDSDKQYINDVYRGIISDIPGLNKIIENNLEGYRLERIYRPDYAALLIATYELIHDIAPVAVVISEAVSLGKKYGTDKSGAFINGVLAKIAKSL